jgi:magnesium transporter
MRRAGPDYLAYALADAVIDSHFAVIDELGERFEKLESTVLSTPDRVTAAEIQELRAALRAIHRATAPHREVANALVRPGTPFVSDETRLYLRDCADHAVQVTEAIELYRETSSDLIDAYLSSISNRTSEAMKVLTIIAAIFIPLSFIAGIYGMNFDTSASSWNMPELRWAFGYPAVLLLMLVIAAGLLLLFRRKGWLG